jgi:hypothetical protein
MKREREEDMHMRKHVCMCIHRVGWIRIRLLRGVREREAVINNCLCHAG